MFMEERLEKILEIIQDKKKVLVKDLSEKFNVSESMIRKDLQRLEKEGKIKRTYGGAILERGRAYNENTTSRVFVNIEGKEHIAKVVCDILEEEDVIFLDISSTNLTIASMIRNTTKNITVITNMNRILMEFDYSPNIEVISVGGTFNKRLGGTVGAYTVEQIKHFNIDKAFVKKEILKNSKKNYIVMDDEKFYKDGAHKFGTLEDVDYIITDKAPDDTVKVELDKYDVKVIY